MNFTLNNNAKVRFFKRCLTCRVCVKRAFGMLLGIINATVRLFKEFKISKNIKTKDVKQNYGFSRC